MCFYCLQMWRPTRGRRGSRWWPACSRGRWANSKGSASWQTFEWHKLRFRNWKKVFKIKAQSDSMPWFLSEATLLIKIGQTQTFFRLLYLFNVEKCPSSIWCWDLNPRPFEDELTHITTRPGLPSCLSYHCVTQFVFLRDTKKPLSRVWKGL